MAKKLGKWALIDIETTGIDSTYDGIIDLGFLQFEGTKLVRSYSSLVRSDVPLSQFIQKLTGITQAMVNKAPVWDKVEPELLDLAGHYLIAHNANFEKKFLEKYFDKLEYNEDRETYQDSMYYLSLLFPQRSSLKLESIMIDLGIAEKEDHRGYEDSLALLKVILVATYFTHKDKEFALFMRERLSHFSTEELWFKRFFNLTTEELLDIAEQIDFNLEEISDKYMGNLFAPESTEDYIGLDDYKFTSKNINNILNNENRIQDFIPTYKFRKAQEDLSLRVGQAFKNNIHALIQAPTGTGKTLGYLIPSALYSLESKEPVLVSTGTKTLQEQALKKDVPLLYKVLGINQEKLKICRLIGSSNHFCELSFRNRSSTAMLAEMESFGEKFSKAYFETVFYHNAHSSNNEIISRDSIPYVFKHILPEYGETEKEIKVDYRACSGHKCPFANECSYIKGLREAKESDIIIGNHALTFTWPRAFPRPAYVVVDEAHKIEGEASKMFTLNLGEKELLNFAKNLTQQLGPLFYILGNLSEPEDDKINTIRSESQNVAKMLMDHLSPLTDATEKYFKKMPRYTSIYWNELPMIKKEGLNDSLGASIYNHLESMHFIIENFYSTLTPHLSRFDSNEFENDESKTVAWTAFEIFMGHIEDIYNSLNCIIKNDPEYTHSLKFHEDQGYVLESGPINIGKFVHDSLLESSNSVVFTSATLANSNGSKGSNGVEWVTGYSYLPTEKRFKTGLYLDAVYDYKNNAKVFVCNDTPSLYDRDFVGTTLSEIIPLIKKLGGKTLLLYSARVRFEKAIEILLKKFDGEIPLFIQGMGSNVIEEFKKSQNGILLGMESFGEGIDIPGESLQLIYIDKVPDLRQDLVIQDRRKYYESNIGNEFQDYFLSHRARALHQKLGRLIRTEKDRGCIIVTDSRLKKWKSGTLNSFNSLMQPYDLNFTTLKDSCEKAEKFLGI